MNTIPNIIIQNQHQLPALGLGTWEMGGRSTADKSNDHKWISAIECAIENGIRHIDTASFYGAGHTEKLVGQAIKNFDRNDLFITTKVAGNHLQFHHVLKSAEESSKRLGINQIDLFLIHWPNPSVPLMQTMSAINKLIDEQNIRYFGLSNFPVSLIREVMFYTNAPIITNQIEYNLFTRNTGSHNINMESEIIPFCLKNGISITAWRPMMKGVVNAAAHPLLVSLADKYNKTPYQIALNWLINKPMMIAIPKMSSEKHILENIGACHFTMEADELLLLDSIQPND